MSEARPWLLADSTWPTVRSAGYQVAVLPWGATEAHNTHLPYATDNIEAGAVAERAAAWAWNAGAKVVVLPTVPFGVNTGQLDIPLCLNMNPTTQLALLRDLVEVVERAGIGVLVLLNGHGGNDFKAIIRELQPDTSVFLCTINWYSCIDPRPFFEHPGDHAGELETSVVQHLAPQLVRPLGEASSGTERRFAIRGLREGWAWAPRHWPSITSDTGVGNPRAASPFKGERFLAAVTERIGEFLGELASTPPDQRYQPGPASGGDS